MDLEYKVGAAQINHRDKDVIEMSIAPRNQFGYPTLGEGHVTFSSEPSPQGKFLLTRQNATQQGLSFEDIVLGDEFILGIRIVQKPENYNVGVFDLGVKEIVQPGLGNEGKGAFVHFKQLYDDEDGGYIYVRNLKVRCTEKELQMMQNPPKEVKDLLISFYFRKI